jgi:hypothetical protein
MNIQLKEILQTFNTEIENSKHDVIIKFQFLLQCLIFYTFVFVLLRFLLKIKYLKIITMIKTENIVLDRIIIK